MRGSRPLEASEIEKILLHLDLPYRTLLILGLRTGFRISELLSLTIKDVTHQGKITASVTVQRRSMKGKHQGRSVVLHPEAQKALAFYIEYQLGKDLPSAPLFPFSRYTAHRHLADAIQRAGLEGKVTTHSMRKTFAKRVYLALNRDLINTQRAMGHASVQSTASYLSFDEDEIKKAILSE